MGVNLNLLASLTENMFSLPMENFSEYFYNGRDVENTIDLTGCTRFANYNTCFQSCNIYADRKNVYSCCITKMYDIPVITDVYGNEGQIYKADMEKLYEEMSSNAEIVKAYRINTLLEEIEKSLTAAEDAINDVNNYGSLLAYTNYMYNIGQYHAYMDSLDIFDTDKWQVVATEYADRVNRMDELADKVYKSLKKTIFGNEYA